RPSNTKNWPFSATTTDSIRPPLSAVPGRVSANSRALAQLSSGSAIVPFLPELVPVGDTLADLALEAALDGLVEDLWLHLLGPVVVAREAVLGIVVVSVALAVADLLHQLGRRVEDVLRRHQAAGLARARRGSFVSLVAGVRFGRGGEVEAGLRQRQFALGAAEKLVGVLRREALHDRLRIGEADVLDRHAHQPAGEVERLLAGYEHPGEVVQRRLRVRAADR